MEKSVVDGKNTLPPGMSHETKFGRAKAHGPRSVKETSEDFIDSLAKEWYKANRLDLLMTWAQGPSNGIDTVIRTFLGEQRLRSDWKDPRLGKALVDLMKGDIAK
jgi:hypothetical protein